MPFAIQALMNPKTVSTIGSVREAHIKYLDDNIDKVLAAGALTHPDGSRAGALFIIDTEDKAVAEKFVAEDPYNKANIFLDIKVTYWQKSYFDKKNLL